MESICSSETKYIIQKETLTPLRHCQEYHLPKGSQILSFQIQGHNIVFWFRFRSDEKEIEVRTLVSLRTGLNYNFTHLKYLTSIQLPSGGSILEVHIHEHRIESKPLAIVETVSEVPEFEFIKEKATL